MSSDIEDRRGAGGGGFGIGGAPLGLGGAVVLLVLSLLFGRNFFTLLDGGEVAQGPAPIEEAAESPEERRARQFVSFVLDDAQGFWTDALPGQAGVPYRRAGLVLFRRGVASACGSASSAAGPFYCPEDGKVYIDLSFYDELHGRFGAPGDFAQAYVIAHEIGHHVQNLLGTSDEVHRTMRSDPQNANAYSVALELQADCYAGVWGHSTRQRNILDPGDLEEGLGAAAAVGDDRIQKSTGRAVNPESWTHGSARQRETWFRRGFESGQIAQCNTFE